MIALWMAYALATGTLIALLCRLVEPIARAARLATRAVWATGMGVMVLIGAVAAAPEVLAPRTALPGITFAGPAAETPPVGRTAPDARRRPEGLPAALRARAELARQALEARLSVAARRLSAWDRPLLLLWLVATAFLSGVVLHAAFEGRRLRHGLQAREVAGTPVLVTEHVGPSAAGARDAAILLPRWALDLDDALLALVVRHEREHLKARDPLLLLATLAALVLLPWHLPLWWCWRRLRLAIEVDCDARVLRAHPDVRRYAQLLLLTGQRTLAPPWASQPLITVVAPLQPHASHLARRIVAMTESRASRSPLRITLLALAVAAVASLALVLPMPRAAAQRPAGDQRAIVRLTHLGLHNTDSPPTILVHTSGAARVGIGTDTAQALTDTLRLNRLPAMTLDVTDGDVHIELVGPGRLEVGGTVTGGLATHVTGEGRHLTLLRGGVGIRIERSR